jgi:hypothetical protein
MNLDTVNFWKEEERKKERKKERRKKSRRDKQCLLWYGVRKAGEIKNNNGN